MGKNHITISVAAEILGVSTQTLRNWDARGLLKAARETNGYRLYDVSALERFARERKHLRKRTRMKLVP